MPGTPPWGRPLAALWQRFFGQLIDGAVAFGLAIAVAFLPPFHNIIASYLAFVAYVLFADGLPGGQSLGKKALGVEVVDTRTGRPCNYGQSFLRNLLLMILGPIDWLFILGERHQRLGDRAADTIVVVSAPRGWQATGWNPPGATAWTPPVPPSPGPPAWTPPGSPPPGTPGWAPPVPPPPPAIVAPPPPEFDPNENPLAPNPGGAECRPSPKSPSDMS